MGAVLGPQYLDTTRQYEIDLAAVDGSSLAGVFNGSESFSARLWPGGLAPTSAVLSAAWDASVAGNPAAMSSPVILLTVSRAAIAALAPATYWAQVLLDPGVTDTEAWTGRIKLKAAGGSAAAPRSYASEADMLLYAPWLEDLQADSDASGFAAELGRATSKLDDAIVDRYKLGSGGPTIGMPGYGQYAMQGGWGDYPPSKWLRDQLDAGLLIVRGKVSEVVAKWAIACVCDAQVVREPEGAFQALGRRFRRDADNLARTLRAEVDLDGDGYPEIVVNLGGTDLR